MISYLEEHINVKLPPPPPKLKVPKLKFMHRHSIDMQYFVVFLRYGSITSEESVKMTSGQIRDLTGVKVKT